MIKKLFTFLCLCTLCIGSAWGAKSYTELFTIKSADVVSNSGYTKYSGTIDGRGWIITYGGNNKSVGTNSSNRSNCKLSTYTQYAVDPVTTSDIASAFVSTSSISNVSKISFTINGGSNQTSTNVYPIYSADGKTFAALRSSDDSQFSATINSDNNTVYDFEFASELTGYFGLLFKATNSSGNWRIDDVNITFYKEAEAPKTLSSISVAAASTAKTSYFVGDTFDPTGLKITAAYDDETTNDIAYEGNESKFSFSPSLETALQTSNTSIEITYGEKTCNQAITVSARPTYTVKFGDDNSTLKEETGGAGVALPTREPANKDYTFEGWSTTIIETETEVVPSEILTGTYHPSADITLYPVYSRSEELVPTTASSSNLSASTTAQTLEEGKPITYKMSASNSYSNPIRVYKGNTLTIAGENMTEIVLTGSDSSNKATNLILKSGSTGFINSDSEKNIVTWTGSAKDVVFEASSAQARVSVISVTYGGGSTTYYTSNPAAIIVKTPTFSPADGTKFASALNVTIACATDGATIKYSTDNGNTWSDYSAAINITETTTIQAKAVKETVESDIVTATYTQLAGLLSMKENGAGTYKLTDAVVTYVNGTNAMIQDATAGAYLYECATDLAVGDVFNGDVTVTTSAYKGLFEVTAFDVTNATKTTGATVEPIVVTAAELMKTENYNKYESMLVTIEGATVASAFSSKSATIKQNETFVTLYDNFNQGLEAEATAVVDVTGYLSKYNNVQFWVKSQDDIVVKSAGKKTSTIKFTKANSSYNVDDVEEFAATAYDEVGVARTDAYTITYESSNPDIAEVEDGYILAYAEGKVTITASTPATDDFAAAEATFDITVLPKGTIWFEDFTGMENTTDVKDKYVTTGTVTLYKETTSGGTAPEILLNGTFKVDLSSKDVDAGIYTLTFNSNNGADISVNGGVVISAVTDKDNAKLWSTQIKVTDPSTFDITFSRTKNSRLDNFILKFDHAANTSDITIAGTGYSSFSSTYAVNIPKGITAYYATAVEGDKVTMTEVEGGVIPANEGVIIKGEPSQEYNFTETVSDKSFYNNKLVAVSEAISGLKPEVTKADGTYKNYVFTAGQFHPFTSDAIVNVGAGKAYLQIKKPADPNAKLEMSFDGGASGIETVINTRAIDNNAIYNLRGERVNTMVKGNVYIVAGKKYLMK